MTFPYTLWSPLAVNEVEHLFRNAPFAWGLAGGYAIEQFLGTSIRPHGDIDVVVFREDQRQLYDWLNEWQLFAADPPAHFAGGMQANGLRLAFTISGHTITMPMRGNSRLCSSKPMVMNGLAVANL
jgi:hypothetical protein